MEKTYGEKIVRTDFNVTNNNNVATLKTRLAEDINLCNTLAKIDPFDDKTRLYDKAIEHLELASMYAVKAATATKD